MTFPDPGGPARHRRRILGRGDRTWVMESREWVLHGVSRLTQELSKYLLNS